MENFDSSKMSENAVVSRHANKRQRERLGLNKKSVSKNAQKALEYGLTHSDVTGSLRRYLDKLYLEKEIANNVRLYHRHVYLFRDNVLITIFPIPNKYVGLVDKLESERKIGSNNEKD